MFPTTEELYPHSKDNFGLEVFDEFYGRYTLLFRERIFRALKNPTRQRRAFNVVFSDLENALTEANWADETACKELGTTMSAENTPCIHMMLSLYVNTQIDFM